MTENTTVRSSAGPDYLSEYDCLMHVLMHPAEHLIIKSLILAQCFYDGLAWRRGAYEKLGIDDGAEFDIHMFSDQLLDKNLFDPDRSVGPIERIVGFSKNEDEAFAFLVGRLNRLGIDPELRNKSTIKSEQALDHDLYDIFEVLLKRPSMYVGRNCFSRVAAFINGIYFGLEHSGCQIRVYPQLDKFEKWLNESLNFGHEGRWDRLILYDSAHEEEGAIIKLRELLKEWRNVESKSDRVNF